MYIKMNSLYKTRLYNSLLRGLLVGLLQSLLQLGRELVVALLTQRLQVELVELGFLIHLGVTNETGEMLHTPGFVQGREHIPGNNVIAHEAQVPE